AGTAAAPATDDPEGWRLAADAHRGLGSFYFAGGQWADAERHNREALAAAVRHRDADPTQPELRYRAALIRASLEAALGAQNRLDESEAEGRTQMAELQQLVDEFPRRTAYLILLAEGLHNRAIHSQRRGRVEQAEREVRRSIELTREWLVAAPNGVAGSKNLANALAVRANLLETMERLPEAESVRREAIATWAKLADDWASVPEYRRRLAECYFDQARGLGLQGRLPEAAEQGRRSVAAARQLAAEFPGDLTTGLFLARGQYDLSRAERRTRNWAAAVAAARGALAETDRLVAVHGPHLDTAWVRANALGVLAFLLEDRVSHQEAVAHAREAVDLRVQVDRDRPTPDHRSELCNSRRELAGFLASLGKVDEAESQLRAAIEESANLPPAARDEFWAATVFELTKVVSRAGRWGEAERWAGQAVDEFTRRHNQHPDNDQWRQACVQSHWHRGTARDRLGRYAEAAADWGTAADLADAQMDKAFYRAHRGASVARSGDAAGAAPELAAAIRLAEAALKADESSGILFYDAAAVYALAAVGAADPAAADRYAAEAVRLLGRAAGVGYLNDPAQVRTMRAADEYVALHPRADFRALLRTLPGGLDTAPPPRERR
ncbi:MAG: hypothetical protein K2X87_25355, partial [Gemmataceae bacterium]|nr:hypothetical protein [Gemmataceae bacterium]